MDKQARIPKSTRPYRLQARAAAMDATRRRITRAAVELHGTVGPAATTMSAVADRAGVTRATLYRHFPDAATLFAACSAEFLAAHPRPDPARWPAAGDPARRLVDALVELYAYYRSTESMRANLLRDLAVLPPAIAAGVAGLPEVMRKALTADWPAEAGPLRRAALGHALAFETWRSLAREGLDDRQGASLMASFVDHAGRRESTDRILLVGMMGAGKTTIGRQLAALTGWPMVDNDELVRRLTGREPRAIDAEDGEDALHDAEAAALQGALDLPPPLIVGVAGAMVDRPDLRETLRQAGHVVWLRARPETLRARIGSGAGRRREARDVTWLAARAAEREALYEATADQVIDVDEAAPGQVAAEILAALGARSAG
jgi:shikimate kinase/AcrR family transcriptional regulator